MEKIREIFPEASFRIPIYRLVLCIKINAIFIAAILAISVIAVGSSESEFSSGGDA